MIALAPERQLLLAFMFGRVTAHPAIVRCQLFAPWFLRIASEPGQWCRYPKVSAIATSRRRTKEIRRG